MSTELVRYQALVRVCDMACAHAAATGADSRPDFFELLAVALSDDCPKQAEAAHQTAHHMRIAADCREQFLATLQPATPPATPELF